MRPTSAAMRSRGKPGADRPDRPGPGRRRDRRGGRPPLSAARFRQRCRVVLWHVISDPGGPAEAERVVDQYLVMTDRKIGVDLEISPAEFVLDLLVALLDPVADAEDPHTIARSNPFARACPPPGPAGTLWPAPSCGPAPAHRDRSPPAPAYPRPGRCRSPRSSSFRSRSCRAFRRRSPPRHPAIAATLLLRKRSVVQVPVALQRRLDNPPVRSSRCARVVETGLGPHGNGLPRGLFRSNEFCE